MWPDNIKPGDKLRITAKSGYHSRRSYVSRIGDILEEKVWYIYTPISEGEYVRLPKGQLYSFLLYTQDGLFQAMGTILEYNVLNDIDFIKIKIFETQRIQRRLFYRLKYLMEFSFTRLSDLSEDDSNNDIAVYKGVSKDIGGGGLRFVSDLKLIDNEHITCRFALNNSEITVEGKVKSIEVLENTKNRYEYRIEFVDIKSSLQEQIVQYVFSKQREMIKKMKEETQLQE